MPLVDPIIATALFVLLAVIGAALCTWADLRDARREQQDTDQ